MTEEQKAVTDEFQAATLRMVEMFQKRMNELDEREQLMNKQKAELTQGGIDLLEREKKVERREREVGNIRQLAAERKTQVDVAQDVATKATELRRKAETEMRQAQTEKARLEETVATLIREKQELQKEIAALRGSDVASDQPEAVVQEARQA